MNDRAREEARLQRMQRGYASEQETVTLWNTPDPMDRLFPNLAKKYSPVEHEMIIEDLRNRNR